MANTKVTALTADTSPTSDDLIPTVTDPAGTPASRSVTLGNAVTKAHGLSDGVMKVASGIMATGVGIDDLSDVTITTPTSGQVIKYNGAAWVNDTDATGGGAANAFTTIAADGGTSPTPDSTTDTLTIAGGAGITTTGDSATDTITIDIDSTVATLTDSQTLTNKTLTTPIISSISNTGTLTLPTSTDTLVGQATTDTFTNKTFDANGTGNSLSNVEVADMAATSVVTAAEGLASSDNDTSLPTTAAVIDGLAAKQDSGATLTSLEGLTLGAGDLLYATAADTLADLPIGTASQVLAVNAGATAPEWVTISSSGGQTLVTHIVAASGGTHTTLGAAIAAASAGDTIYVREGTYTESAITSATNSLTIIGENPVTSVISMGANNLTLSGTGITIMNLGITSTTGDLTFSGASSVIEKCIISHASGTAGFTQSGNYGMLRNCRMTSTSAASTGQFVISGTENSCIGNRFALSNSSGSTSDGAIQLSSASGIFSNNIIYGGTASNDNHADIIINSANFNFSGNYHDVTADPHKCLITGVAGVSTTITGNVFEGGAGRIMDIVGGHSYIANNIIRLGNDSAVNYGIYITTDNNTVVGNKIYCTGVVNTGGIYCNRDFNLMTGNMIVAGVIGVELTSAADSNLITGNYFYTTATPISDSGTTNTALANRATAASLINETKEIQTMKNTSGGALAIGDLVVWKPVAAGNEITTTTTAGDDKIFGVMVDAPANNAFGRVQTLGKNTVLKVDGTTDIAIGDPITTFTTAGIGAKAAAGDMIIGYALEAYIADNSLGVIDVLLITPRLI